MAKLVKKKKTGLRSLRSAGGGSAVETSPLRPKFVEKMPPCINTCPNGNNIRGALVAVSRAEEFGQDLDAQIKKAAHILLETTPFPSTCGRVCPHPCEAECNRKDKDGSVGINSFERFAGDFALENRLTPLLLTDEKRAERIAVIGSGPAGLSCAYQLARRGYPVTVFEAFPKAGGMLRYGIPDYRLPQSILDTEIDRILDMGVELRLNTIVGKDVPYQDLQKEYKAIFVGLGAHQGMKLGVKGEDASNVYTGTELLHRINAGETVDVGNKVVVIGGGDTAIDAARIARRLGADCTILYRRTRAEMPAIDEEIVGAEEEGVAIEYLAAPVEIYTRDGKAAGMKCQRMQLGEPDASGRRRPVPIEGDTYDINLSTLIAAISQEPDFTGFENLVEGKDWIKVNDKFMTKQEQVFSGGDDLNLGLVVHAISHGRMAAMAIHEMITGQVTAEKPALEVIRLDKMAHGYYEAKEPAKREQMPVEQRLRDFTAEITGTWSKDTAVAEAKRCMSCGFCFDCGACWSFCQDNAIIRPVVRGGEYKFKMEFCNGCKKCAENCPCGYIEMH